MREIFEYLKVRYLSEKAQGMAEYALVLAFVVVVIAAVMTSKGTLSDAIKGAFNKVSNGITNAN